MARKLKKQQNQQGKPGAWPMTLYLTPDRWSAHAEVYAVDKAELRRMVTELRKLGGEWRSVSMNNATPIFLVSIEGDDTAIYGRGVHPTYRGGILYLVQRHQGPDGVWYDWEQV